LSSPDLKVKNREGEREKGKREKKEKKEKKEEGEGEEGEGGEGEGERERDLEYDKTAQLIRISNHEKIATTLRQRNPHTLWRNFRGLVHGHPLESLLGQPLSPPQSCRLPSLPE
jgi:hypothetical protein